MNIPYEVRQLVTIIESYNPILVGGCVRDSLMGIEPKDFDIVVDRLDTDLLDIIIAGGWRNTQVQTNEAKIWNLTKLFPVYNTVPGTNIQYIEKYKPYLIEVLEYSNGNIENDSKRRDLTINSLYYDIANDKVIDPTGRGLEDIQNKVIRFNHKDVVLNDRLRILRAYRFAKKFGFTIEDRSLTLCRNEFDAMVKEISPTRMLKEIEKLCL